MNKSKLKRRGWLSDQDRCSNYSANTQVTTQQETFEPLAAAGIMDLFAAAQVILSK